VIRGLSGRESGVQIELDKKPNCTVPPHAGQAQDCLQHRICIMKTAWCVARVRLTAFCDRVLEVGWCVSGVCRRRRYLRPMAATRIRGEATSAVEHQRDKNEWPERPVADVTLVRWFRNRILAGMRRNAAAAFDTAGPTGDINVYKWVDIAFTCMRKKSQRSVEAGERERVVSNGVAHLDGEGAKDSALQLPVMDDRAFHTRKRGTKGHSFLGKVKINGCLAESFHFCSCRPHSRPT